MWHIACDLPPYARSVLREPVHTQCGTHPIVREVQLVSAQRSQRRTRRTAGVGGRGAGTIWIVSLLNVCKSIRVSSAAFWPLRMYSSSLLCSSVILSNTWWLRILPPDVSTALCTAQHACLKIGKQTRRVPSRQRAASCPGCSTPDVGTGHRIAHVKYVGAVYLVVVVWVEKYQMRCVLRRWKRCNGRWSFDDRRARR